MATIPACFGPRRLQHQGSALRGKREGSGMNHWVVALLVCLAVSGCGSSGSRSAPLTPTPLRLVTAIAAGANGSCAIVNGGAQCWGDNGYGELGNNCTNGQFRAGRCRGPHERGKCHRGRVGAHLRGPERRRPVLGGQLRRPAREQLHHGQPCARPSPVARENGTAISMPPERRSPPLQPSAAGRGCRGRIGDPYGT